MTEKSIVSEERDTQVEEPLDLELEYPYHYTKEGEVPFWDHPHLKGHKIYPDGYFPIATSNGVLSLFNNQKLKEEDMVILKVIGDAICPNLKQLQRIMALHPQLSLSKSQISSRLKELRRRSLADRWNVRIIGNDEVKPPSPFTLGVGGYKLLKHLYNSDFFMDPQRWDRYGVQGLIRYVAMNEIFVSLAEAKVLRQWNWHPYLNNNPSLNRPLAAAKVESPKGTINFLFDRPQMSKDYVGYVERNLQLWSRLYEKKQSIPVTDFEEKPTVVVLYTSTYTMAQEIHAKLMLDSYAFPLWICVEEDIHRNGLSQSFYRAKGEELAKLQVSWLET